MSRNDNGRYGAGHAPQRIAFSHGRRPGGLGVLLLLPAVFAIAGFAALVAVGGLVLSLVIPLVWRKRRGGQTPTDSICIELDPHDYRTIETDSSPPR